jgi:hypothetical protein
MPKNKKLNGLPHNLTNSFFGTERYYSCGFMADWIYNAARILNITECTIDILNQNISPNELNLHPLLINLKDLPTIINKELIGNGLPADFITEAKIRIEFTNFESNLKTFNCFPSLTDKEGNIYDKVQILEKAYENIFNPFVSKNVQYKKPNLLDKIKTLLK